jgi:putative DNA primase/helicase
MRQDDFEFEPQFKLLIAGNHKPRIKAVDEAIKRRIHLVPFTVTIPAEERDKALLTKLRAEWPRILQWCIDGCLKWQEHSLSPGERIIAATEQYVEAEDILGQWLEECCERSGQAEGRTLFEVYKKWCETQGEQVWTRRSWSNAMIDRGFAQVRTASFRGYAGVRPKPMEHQPQGYDVG